MLQLILALCLGVVCGRLIKGWKMSRLPHLITLMTILLLFILGLEIGGNDQIIRNYRLIIGQAFVIAMASIFGSVLFVRLFEYFVLRRADLKKGEKDEK